MTDTRDPTEVALRNAIRANPADTLARLVYADWLDEHDNPDLATYIRLECEQDCAGMVALCERTGRNFGGWEFAEELTRLHSKMDTVRLFDPSHVLFGAAKHGRFGHGYELLPPIPEWELVRFEAKLGFRLPVEYRAFLLHIGNGPMGPYFGLSPLDVNQHVGDLRKPFPFTRADADRIASAPTETDASLHFADDDSDAGGYLFLSEVGCGIFDLLALNGDTRGMVWTIGSMCELVLSRTDAGEPHNFLSWYEAWLDHGLRPDVLADYRSRQA